MSFLDGQNSRSYVKKIMRSQERLRPQEVNEPMSLARLYLHERSIRGIVGINDYNHNTHEVSRRRLNSDIIA